MRARVGVGFEPPTHKKPARMFRRLLYTDVSKILILKHVCSGGKVD